MLFRGLGIDFIAEELYSIPNFGGLGGNDEGPELGGPARQISWTKPNGEAQEV